jgi:hypothetical protein
MDDNHLNKGRELGYSDIKNDMKILVESTHFRPEVYKVVRRGGNCIFLSNRGITLRHKRGSEKVRDILGPVRVYEWKEADASSDR